MAADTSFSVQAILKFKAMHRKTSSMLTCARARSSLNFEGLVIVVMVTVGKTYFVYPDTGTTVGPMS